MNAQTNFQQFVSSNQGKLITFKHQGADISKYVVDVCGEYFTCKGRETDAKIDGFYYFSDCEMYKPTLIDILTIHRYVVLIGEKSPMCDAFFEYKYCKEANNTLMILGKQLSATNPDVGYAASYIGEVWAIVEGKYTKVWEKTNGSLLINGDDLKKIGIRKFDAISESEKKQTYEEEIKGEYESKDKVSEKEPTGQVKIEYRGKPKTVEIMNDKSFINGKEYVLAKDLKDGTPMALLKKNVKYVDEDKVSEKEPETSSSVKIEYRGKPKTVEIMNDKSFINGKEYVLAKDLKDGTPMALLKKNVKYFEDEEKVCAEEEIKKEKVQWYKDTSNDWIELCKEEGSIYSDNFISMMTTIKNEPYSKELYDGLCLSYEYLRDSFLRTFKGEFNRPKVQALTKRFLVLTTEFRKKFGNNDSSVNSLVEFVNKEMSVEGGIIYKRKFEDKKGSEKEPVGPVIAESSVQSTSGASGPVKIEYRGKEKIVEIMNECTHKNGKKYIWVRDLSDKGKTKTLFKEYVKYV